MDDSASRRFHGYLRTVSRALTGRGPATHRSALPPPAGHTHRPCAGNVCVANLQKFGITAISPAGEVLGEFVTPEYDSYVTNICFGGPSGDTAFVCSSGRGILYSLQWPGPACG